MTNEQAKKMLKAKLECLKRETSGTDFDCNNSNCDECPLCYEQGNMREQKEALDRAIKALEQQPCEDTISRQAAIDAMNGIINRFEQILRDIRESKVDDSVCGMCEYDGAFVGQSGDWCNECPGFEKDDCFRLSDECRKRWLESVELPAAQPEKRTNKRTETHACDLISRQAAIEYLMTNMNWYDEDGYESDDDYKRECITDLINGVPSAQETRQSRH